MKTPENHGPDIMKIYLALTTSITLTNRSINKSVFFYSQKKDKQKQTKKKSQTNLSKLLRKGIQNV
jgi:hypothetical protein